MYHSKFEISNELARLLAEQAEFSPKVISTLLVSYRNLNYRVNECVSFSLNGAIKGGVMNYQIEFANDDVGTACLKRASHSVQETLYGVPSNCEIVCKRRCHPA